MPSSSSSSSNNSTYIISDTRSTTKKYYDNPANYPPTHFINYFSLFPYIAMTTPICTGKPEKIVDDESLKTRFQFSPGGCRDISTGKIVNGLVKCAIYISTHNASKLKGTYGLDTDFTLINFLHLYFYRNTIYQHKTKTDDKFKGINILWLL